MLNRMPHQAMQWGNSRPFAPDEGISRDLLAYLQELLKTLKALKINIEDDTSLDTGIVPEEGAAGMEDQPQSPE